MTISTVFEDHRTRGRQNAAGDWIFNVRWADADGTGHISVQRHKTRSYLEQLHDAFTRALAEDRLAIRNGEPVIL